MRDRYTGQRHYLIFCVVAGFIQFETDYWYHFSVLTCIKKLGRSGILLLGDDEGDDERPFRMVQILIDIASRDLHDR